MFFSSVWLKNISVFKLLTFDLDNIRSFKWFQALQRLHFSWKVSCRTFYSVPHDCFSPESFLTVELAGWTRDRLSSTIAQQLKISNWKPLRMFGERAVVGHLHELILSLLAHRQIEFYNLKSILFQSNSCSIERKRDHPLERWNLMLFVLFRFFVSLIKMLFWRNKFSWLKKVDLFWTRKPIDDIFSTSTVSIFLSQKFCVAG